MTGDVRIARAGAGEVGGVVRHGPRRVAVVAEGECVRRQCDHAASDAEVCGHRGDLRQNRRAKEVADEERAAVAVAYAVQVRRDLRDDLVAVRRVVRRGELPHVCVVYREA